MIIALFIRLSSGAGHASGQHGRTAAVSVNTSRAAFKPCWRDGTLRRGKCGPGGRLRIHDSLSGSRARRRGPSRRHERSGTGLMKVLQDPLRCLMNNSRTSPDTTARRCRACHRDPRHWEKSSHSNGLRLILSFGTS